MFLTDEHLFNIENGIDDFSRKLKSHQVYIDKSEIDRSILVLLRNRRLAILGHQGRGKTFFTKTLLYKLSQQGKEIRYLDAKDFMFLEIRRFIDQLLKVKTSGTYVIGIDNFHTIQQNKSRLLQLINNVVQSHDNLFFIINYRPFTTKEILNPIHQKWSKECEIKLTPNIMESKSILENALSRKLGKNELNWLDLLFAGGINGVNLRILQYYLDEVLNNPTLHLSDISESDITEKFLFNYFSIEDRELINKTTLLQFKSIAYIASIYQLDLPVKLQYNDSMIALSQKGLISVEYETIHLPHTTDAFFIIESYCLFRKVNKKKFVSNNLIAYIKDKCNNSDANSIHLTISPVLSKLYSDVSEYEHFFVEITSNRTLMDSIFSKSLSLFNYSLQYLKLRTNKKKAFEFLISKREIIRNNIDNYYGINFLFHLQHLQNDYGSSEFHEILEYYLESKEKAQQIIDRFSKDTRSSNIKSLIKIISPIYDLKFETKAEVNAFLKAKKTNLITSQLIAVFHSLKPEEKIVLLNTWVTDLRISETLNYSDLSSLISQVKELEIDIINIKKKEKILSALNKILIDKEYQFKIQALTDKIRLIRFSKNKSKIINEVTMEIKNISAISYINIHLLMHAFNLQEEHLNTIINDKVSQSSFEEKKVIRDYYYKYSKKHDNLNGFLPNAMGIITKN